MVNTPKRVWVGAMLWNAAWSKQSVMATYPEMKCPRYNLLQKKACFHYVDILFPMKTPWGKSSRLLLPPAGYKRRIPFSFPLQFNTMQRNWLLGKLYDQPAVNHMNISKGIQSEIEISSVNLKGEDWLLNSYWIIRTCIFLIFLLIWDKDNVSPKSFWVANKALHNSHLAGSKLEPHDGSSD